jgi:rod shape-determining protein MreC
MEHTPPPFFKRGPAPLIRLAFFASLSLALLVIDKRFGYADALRSAFALAAYPIQVVATAPVMLGERIAGYFSTQAALVGENERLRERLLAASRDAQRFEAASAEAAQLRKLIGAAERLGGRSTPAEIVYASRDPFAHKVFIDKGLQHGLAPGSPVIDESGVVGQVTRAHPLVSEVTLVTDKDQAIPVQVVRNGLRTIAFGAGAAGTLELRYMAANAEIENGDQLVTSGIDGTYPRGLPVATVTRVERDSAHAFARVVCQPAAGVQRGRYVLVVSHETKLPPVPGAAQPGKERRADKPRRARLREADGSR